MTKNDVMKDNVDMVRHAARILASQPCYYLSVQAGTGKNRTLRISASSRVRPRERRRRISHVDVFVNGRPHKSLSARNGMLSPTTVAIGKSPKFDWLVQAFDHHDTLVASARSQR